MTFNHMNDMNAKIFAFFKVRETNIAVGWIADCSWLSYDVYTLFLYIRMVYFHFKMNILSFLSEIILLYPYAQGNT